MRRFLSVIILFCTAQAFAQVYTDSAFWEEKEDTVSSISIKRLKPAQAKKLLDKVITQIKRDAKQKHEVGKYQIEATFCRDTLPPFTVGSFISTEAGIGLGWEGIHETLYKAFYYKGDYELNRRDSDYVKAYLKAFALLSPVHIVQPYLIGVKFGDVLNPFMDYNTTLRFYNFAAYSIEDDSGRGVYRLLFVRNKKPRLFEFRGVKYDIGEVVGSAYFDRRTLRMTQFKGEAHLPTYQHVVRLRYQIDYDEKDEAAVLRQNKITWEWCGTVIKAIVQKLTQ